MKKYSSDEKQRMEDIYPSENKIIFIKGKYYNKPRYFPYFDNLRTRKKHIHQVNNRFIFKLTDEDRRLFPELSEQDYLEVEFESIQKIFEEY